MGIFHKKYFFLSFNFKDIFSTELFDNRSIVIQLLALFYLISYNYKLEIAPIAKGIAGTTRAPLVYSQKLWAKIPIRYLLIMMDIRHKDFSTFRPVLLRFISASMPHMLPTIDSTLHHIDQQISNYEYILSIYFSYLISIFFKFYFIIFF